MMLMVDNRFADNDINEDYNDDNIVEKRGCFDDTNMRYIFLDDHTIFNSNF